MDQEDRMEETGEKVVMRTRGGRGGGREGGGGGGEGGEQAEKADTRERGPRR